MSDFAVIACSRPCRALAAPQRSRTHQLGCDLHLVDQAHRERLAAHAARIQAEEARLKAAQAQQRRCCDGCGTPAPGGIDTARRHGWRTRAAGWLCPQCREGQQ